MADFVKICVNILFFKVSAGSFSAIYLQEKSAHFQLDTLISDTEN